MNANKLQLIESRPALVKSLILPRKNGENTLLNKSLTDKTPGITQVQFSIESACMCLEIGSSAIKYRWQKKGGRSKIRSAYLRPEIGRFAMMNRRITKRK